MISLISIIFLSQIARTHAQDAIANYTTKVEMVYSLMTPGVSAP